MGPPECSGPPAANAPTLLAAGRTGLSISVERYDNRVRTDSHDASRQPFLLTRNNRNNDNNRNETEGLHHSLLDLTDEDDIGDLPSMLDYDDGHDDNDAAAAINDVVDMMECDEDENEHVDQAPTHQLLLSSVSARDAAAAVYRELQFLKQQPTPTPTTRVAVNGTAPATASLATATLTPVLVPLLPSTPLMPLVPQMSPGSIGSMRDLIAPPHMSCVIEKNKNKTNMTQQQCHDLQQMRQQREQWDHQQMRLNRLSVVAVAITTAATTPAPAPAPALAMSMSRHLQAVVFRSKQGKRTPKQPRDKKSSESKNQKQKTKGRAKRWTSEETDCLAHGVAIYGVGSWLKIKNHFHGELQDRTNVDLKDRWRNVGGPRQSQKQKRKLKTCVAEVSRVQISYGLNKRARLTSICN